MGWSLVSPYNLGVILYAASLHREISIHSFIHLAISIAPLQVFYYSEALPTTARILYRSFTPKRHRQLQVKDLPKVLTWLERESTPRPSGLKSSPQPRRYHVPLNPFASSYLYVSICSNVTL